MGKTVADILGKAVFDKALDVMLDPNVPISDAQAPTVARKVEAAIKPIVVNATNSEPWYQSRVILGALVGVIASALGVAGIVIDEQTRNELVVLIPVLISTGGSLYALYGRIVGARKKPLGQ